MCSSDLASLILDLTVGRKARMRPAPTEKPGAEVPTGQAPAAPTPNMPQGELFPGELAQARTATEGIAGPAKPEVVVETKPVSLRGVPDTEQEAVRGLIQENFKTTLDPQTGDIRVEPQDFAAVQQLLADVGVKAPDMKSERDTQTRDMISEMETADIQKMVDTEAKDAAKKEDRKSTRLNSSH